jgi:hypothetical protein
MNKYSRDQLPSLKGKNLLARESRSHLHKHHQATPRFKGAVKRFQRTGINVLGFCYAPCLLQVLCCTNCLSEERESA